MKHKIWVNLTAFLFLFILNVPSTASENTNQILSPIEKEDVIPPSLNLPSHTNRFSEVGTAKVYMLTDVYEKCAWIKIDEKFFVLPVDDSRSEKVIPYMEIEEGDRFRLIFESEGINVCADYLATMVGRGGDCVRIRYTVKLMVTRDKSSQSISLINERGC